MDSYTRDLLELKEKQIEAQTALTMLNSIVNHLVKLSPEQIVEYNEIAAQRERGQE